MFVLGVILLILGAIFNVTALWVIGLILAVIGGALYLLGAAGRQVGPRKHYW